MKIAYRRTAAWRVAGVAVAAFALAPSAHAVGTDAGTSIDNVATVDFEVGGIAQTPIESSPSGNSTPGAGNGTATSFVVDNRVDLTLIEQSGAQTPVSPGQADAVAEFLLTNTGNDTQDYALSAVNLAAGTTVFGGDADTIDANNLRAFADTDGSGDFSGGDQPFVDSLAADASILVFVVADVPIGATNDDYANVTLTATTAEAGSSGATIVTATTGGDTAGVDIVFGDAGNDGLESADDGYLVSSATLTVTKSETIISDPFNGTTDPLHIPGAVIEYAITVVNTGSADATNVGITDVIDTATLELLLAQYNGGAADISYDLAGATLFCTADAGDADADNCGLSGSTLEADLSATLGTNTGVDDTLVVRFQVTIL
ncbi:MAG: hypothetical protein AAFN07_03675 [Pseudomonadota bacterium]